MFADKLFLDSRSIDGMFRTYFSKNETKTVITALNMRASKSIGQNKGKEGTLGFSR